MIAFWACGMSVADLHLPAKKLMAHPRQENFEILTLRYQVVSGAPSNVLVHIDY